MPREKNTPRLKTQVPQFVKVGTAARILGLSAPTVRAAVKRGELAGVRIGTQTLVRREALEALVGGPLVAA